MSLAWYAKRLASMSAPELVHRVGEQAKRSVSRTRSYGWEAFERAGALRPVPGLRDLFTSNVTPTLAAAIREAADAHIEGAFSAHGVTWPKRPGDRLFPEEVWRLDPVTGRLWPGNDAYCFDLQYRHRRDLGDIKYVWDFNRLQFLQPLAAAVALWKDQRALSALEAALESWAQYNRPFYGLGWNSGIELSLRAVSLVFAVSLCGENLSAGARARIATMLRAHLFWLTRFPSRFSSANNHLVAEARGEFLIATVLDDEGTSAIADHARQTLEREAALQIHPDGAGAEQSPSYAAFTAEMLLVASIVARAVGRPLNAGVDERLRAFAVFIGWLSDARGRVPSFGDDDEGRVLTLCADREAAYSASVARAICGYLGAPLSVPSSHDAPELRDALFPLRDATVAAPEGFRTFEAGGYSVARERRGGRRVRFVFDHGPLGYLSIAAHGHADANAFTLSLDDEDVLVDPGTFLYHSGGNWRKWFRGTLAHNTLAVEGVDQSIIAGPFNWSHKARATMEAVDAAEPWHVAASHDGYLKRFGVEHQRVVKATDTGLAVLDTLSSAKRPLHVEVSWQFAPGLDLRRDERTVTVHRDATVLMTVILPQGGEIAIESGGEDARGGWVSQAFGHKEEACRLSWRGFMPTNGLATEFAW